jgi:CheY-like chemotaxis protein
MSPEEKRLILVVDDEPRMRKFMQMNLELEGFRVAEAANGLEALERTREDLPDLVVLDVMMPEMDGFEALEHIRETWFGAGGGRLRHQTVQPEGIGEQDPGCIASRGRTDTNRSRTGESG